MLEKIIIAGSGGQGIMLFGKVLAEAAVKEGKHVTWLPAYGAEVRGGTAHCMIVISDDEIGSPHIDKADTLIIMNNPSLEKFAPRIASKGLFIINSSLAQGAIKKQARCLRHPFTEVAVNLGNIKVANMVALGCYLAEKKTINPISVIKTMQEMAPEGKPELLEINQKALSAGQNLVIPPRKRAEILLR